MMGKITLISLGFVFVDEGEQIKTALSQVASIGFDAQSRTFRQPQYGTIDVWWLYDDGGK